MNLYPAIDIYQGNAVRLRQGRREEVTIYGEPLEMALRWVSVGASWLHVVDLDGAFDGVPRNTSVIESIRLECPGVKIQVGGGIRSVEAIEELVQLGIERVILGTAAVQDSKFLAKSVDRFGELIAVGIDARDETVRIAGWTSSARVTAIDLALRIEQAGVGVVVYTDIARDGGLGGVNVAANRKMLDCTKLKIISSGGISSMGDLAALSSLDNTRIDGAIVGKALYEGKIDLKKALAYFLD